MSDRSELLPHSSVAEYFHDVVSEVLRNQEVEASAHAEFYLVNLLSEYSHVTSWESDKPLALMLAEASEAEPSVRLRKLRAIGDHSLYVSGFFGESLSRKLVDSDYYITIGGGAYRSLASACTHPPWPETYLELSGNFPALVEVLQEVSSQTQLGDDSGLLKLYERYLRTGSKWVARRLRGLGMTGLLVGGHARDGGGDEGERGDPGQNRRGRGGGASA